MASYRTSSVFHFTAQYELLKKIIKQGIIPNYCEEDLSFDETDFCVGIPMACFCDIPITLLDEHTGRYGKYGVALTKEWARKNGLNPVMYITNNEVIRSVYYYHENVQAMLNDEQSMVNGLWMGCGPGNINRRLCAGEIAQRLGALQEHFINLHIIGYLKKYDSNTTNNYEENEWRYLVPENDETKWFWSREGYMKWSNPDNKTKEEVKKPAPSPNLCQHTLKFETKDISYILVKDATYKARMIQLIKKLTSVGGNKITDAHLRDDLISKVITLEQVKRDF